MPSNIGKVRDSDSREPFSDTRYRSPGRQKDRLRSFFSLTFSISPPLTAPFAADTVSKLAPSSREFFSDLSANDRRYPRPLCYRFSIRSR